MDVFGLYGKSGTGKSYQAMNLCQRRHIEAIIDDGLFIAGGTVVAGVSAKRQSTMIGAIKTALFTDPGHRDQVAAAIRELSPASLLVLGTSEEMLHRIAKRLGLPEFKELIPIESITSPKERAKAMQQRMEKGKHVIPVPTFQIKRQFSGYFVDPLRRFRSIGKHQDQERTVVRPTYSYKGEYYISDKAIGDIVRHAAREIPGIRAVLRVIAENSSDGLRMEVLLQAGEGYPLMEMAKTLQKSAAEAVETMTSFNIVALDVEVRSLQKEA